MNIDELIRTERDTHGQAFAAGLAEALTLAWRAVDACGGTMPASTIAERAYAAGYNSALDVICSAIEAAGGKPS